MTLSAVDWIIIIGYFLIALGIGVAFSRRAGRSLTDYFISGRSFPWWIAGTSMVATTFAADTPLAVTGLVAEHGLAGNWFWWAFAMGGMFTVFVYARLWRRAEVMTDVELVELRYSGKPAAFLRGFRSLYIALLVNAIIIGWVTGAMLKVLKNTVFSGTDLGAGSSDWTLILIMLGVVGVYSTLAGLWGVAITDFFQFIVAMGGSVVLAVLAVHRVGGISVLRERVSSDLVGGEQAFRYLPDFFASDPWMPLGVFFVMLFVQWWASWYPGAEPGGGGYVVQRMASCRDERHSILATLWFQIAHYCIRPWPWLLVAFVALALYPDLQHLADPGVGYPRIIRDIAPDGLRGIMLVTFFAAFMSTISTQMNWGASYLVGDFYRRFLRPDAGDAHLTWASRVASIVVLGVGAGAAWIMKDVSVDEAWKFLAALGAGTGAVFMLRWFWWRINAWTEIASMVASLGFFLVVSQFVETSEYRLAIVAGLTIVVWLAVTYLTKPESPETLDAFYRQVRPAGPGWGPVAARVRDVEPDTDLGQSILMALLGSAVVYLTIPGVGLVVFGEWGRAALTLGGALVAGVVLVRLLGRAVGNVA